MIMSVWQGVGFQMVIWLAGLQTIPYVLYEAAQIDGAGRWNQFRHVTWPGLRNTAVFVFIVITIQAFALFTQIDVMTQGGPLDTTQTVIFQAVQRGFERQDIAIRLDHRGRVLRHGARRLADPALADEGALT